MTSVLDDIETFLPLKITKVAADSAGIALGGDHWRYRVNTNWRVTAEGNLILSPSMSVEGSTSLGLEILSGDEAVEVSMQSSSVGLDLMVKTRAGRVLEVFSDFPYGEWSFSIWSRTDPAKTPIFDVQGPLHEGPSGGEP